MRNLLEEFNEDHGVRPPSILGVREHIFTGRLFFILYSVPSIVLLHLHFVLLINLIFISCELQCFFIGMVYVKSRNELCDHRSKSSCKTSEVCFVSHVELFM